MATLVASAGGGEAASSPPPSSSGSSRDDSQQPSGAVVVHPERLSSADEVITFLLDHFVPYEPILSSLAIENRSELRVLLADVVQDCVSCSASCGVRDESGMLAGVCLASRPALFEKQMDRLCLYKFKDEKLCTAIEFLKYVFNRVDVVFHCEEQKIRSPIFVALISVRIDRAKRGIGSSLLSYCLSSAVDEKCDGALVLCSGRTALKLLSKRFAHALCRIRYGDYRGEYREPPIVPRGDDDALHVLLTKLSSS